MLAEREGFLDRDVPLPDDATLLAVLGAPRRHAPSSVEPYAEIVQELLDQHVEMTTILNTPAAIQARSASNAWRGRRSSVVDTAARA